MRLFVALEIPEALRAALAARVHEARRRLPEARWVSPEGLHLTLLFIGEAPPEVAETLCGALAPVFARHRPMRLRLSGAGTFPPGRPARVAWLAVEGAEEAPALHEDVRGAAEACVGRDLAEGRPFHLHLTLARCPRPWPASVARRFIDFFAGGVGDAFEATGGVLFRSRLGVGGARYEPVAVFAMSAP